MKHSQVCFVKTTTRSGLLYRLAAGLVIAFTLAACGGGGGGGGSDQGNSSTGGTPSPNNPTSYTVGGSISGLSGTITLQNNGGDLLNISQNGTFTFSAPLANGATYQISIVSQPIVQQCSISFGNGEITSSNVSDIAISCTTPTFSVGGEIQGLFGSISLRNNGQDEINISSSGDFTFPAKLMIGAAYHVTIENQPDNQHCQIQLNEGTVASSDIDNVTISCLNTYEIGGIVSGLTGTLEVQISGDNIQSISSDGLHIFASNLTNGSSYEVQITSQPENQQCSITNNTGFISGSDIANINIACISTYTIGGTINGLQGTATLHNGSSSQTISSNGPFTFDTAQTSGSGYSVSISPSNYPNQRCVVSEGEGTVGSSNITNIEIDCIGKSALYETASYSNFTSLNGIENLEGTWMLLMEGTMSRGTQIAGTNPREDYQLWARSTVHIRKIPAPGSGYYLFSCGPGGGRNTNQADISSGTFFIPFFDSNTSSWLSYGVNVIDATTMRRTSVSRAYSYSGAPGLSVGYSFSWILKRISDDPYKTDGTLADHLSPSTSDARCIFESEGTFVATENDGVSETFRKEGTFQWVDAYIASSSQMQNDANSFTPSFSLKNLQGLQTIFRDFTGSYYRTSSGDSIDTIRAQSGTETSTSVSSRSQDALLNAEVTLIIAP